MRLFDAFITSAVLEIKNLACDKSILLESRKLSKLQMKKLYDEMNTFISDERDRLGREMNLAEARLTAVTLVDSDKVEELKAYILGFSKSSHGLAGGKVQVGQAPPTAR